MTTTKKHDAMEEKRLANCMPIIKQYDVYNLEKIYQYSSIRNMPIIKQYGANDLEKMYQYSLIRERQINIARSFKGMNYANNSITKNDIQYLLLRAMGFVETRIFIHNR